MSTTDGADETALKKSYAGLEPIEAAAAERLLKEAKHIFDELGVPFFLRQGTCLGAIRDNGFITWDDDIDLGTVIGPNGIAERSIDKVVAAFRSREYFAKVDHNNYSISVEMIKSSVRIDWTCYRIINDEIIHFPGIVFPARLFTDLKEIDFLGEKFHVPNPPEEYLRLKYGAQWTVPKQAGYEKDVIDMIPETLFSGQVPRWKQLLEKHILTWRASRLRVLDHVGSPVSNANVRVAGIGLFKTNRSGYAKFILPCEDWYAVVTSHGDFEEILYLERLARGKTYVYRPDPQTSSGRLTILTEE